VTNRTRRASIHVIVWTRDKAALIINTGMAKEIDLSLWYAIGV
jgi:hypothetical protein